jgi:hypothetical protein
MGAQLRRKEKLYALHHLRRHRGEHDLVLVDPRLTSSISTVCHRYSCPDHGGPADLSGGEKSEGWCQGRREARDRQYSRGVSLQRRHLAIARASSVSRPGKLKIVMFACCEHPFELSTL